MKNQEWKQKSDDEKVFADGVARCLSTQTEALATDWTVETLHPGSEHPPSWLLVSATLGAKLDIGFDRHDAKKIVISGNVPKTEWLSDPENRWWNGCDSSISVAALRGTETTAKEITRRLMPDYLPKLAAAYKSRTENHEYHTKRKAATLAMMAAFGTSAREYDLYQKEPKRETFNVYKGGSNSVSVDVQTYTDSANITMSVPNTLARTIGALVREYMAGATASVAGSVPDPPLIRRALEAAECDCRCSIHNDTAIPTLWDSPQHAILTTTFCNRVTCLRCTALATMAEKEKTA